MNNTTIDSDSQTVTIIFKAPKSLKDKLTRRAKLKGFSLSEYMRDIAQENIGFKNKEYNPFLELFGIMSDQEAGEFNNSIYNSRINKD